MRPNRLYALIIFGVCFILYAKTIGFDFSYFDDNHIFIYHQSYFESKDIQKFLTTDPYLEHSTNYYRPIQSLSFLTDVVVSGGINPWMFHLTNTLLFGVIGCLLFFMLLKFNVPNRVAFIGTLIFCVHPIFVTAVAWIPARGDLLLTLFGVLSTIFFIKFTEQGKIKHLLIVWLTFTLALFSKETAALLPLLFLIYFLTIAPASHRKVTLRHILLGVFIGISGLVWLYARSLAISLGEHITFLKVFRNFLSIPVAFSQLLMLPIDFSPWPSFTPAKIVVGLFVMILLFFMVAQKTKRAFKGQLFYLLWFVILLFPNFLSIQWNNVDYIDHRFLLPMTGILLFVLPLFSSSVAQEEGAGTFRSRDLIWICAVTALGIVSFFKTDVYKDSDSYYGAIIHYNQERVFAYNQRGILRFSREDITQAMDDFNQAIQLDSEYIDAYHNRGTLKFGLGDLAGAMDDLNRAITLNPDYAEAYVDRAVIKGVLGNVDDALDDINRALVIKPDLKEAYFNRAIAYYTIKEYEKALQDLEKVLEMAPGNEQAMELKVKILNTNEVK